jgi:hypothetical protein
MIEIIFAVNRTAAKNTNFANEEKVRKWLRKVIQKIQVF